MIELLTEQELNAITDYRTYFAPRSNNTNSLKFINTERLLTEWENSKTIGGLKQLFGDKLILEKEIQFETPFSETEEEIRERLTLALYLNEHEEFTNAQIFLRRLEKIIEERYNTNYSISYCLRRLYRPYELAMNYYTGDNIGIILPDGKSLKLQYGAKCTKILGKLAQAFNIPYFEDFRLEHSQILNTKVLKGTLCLSIHPLDYMTMSDNDYGWSSCMTWKDYGCYRQGTVEMMNSPMVVVGYLKGSQNMNLLSCCKESADYFEWHNKKWRSLYIINKDIITSIRSYPYKSKSIDEAAISWLAELAKEKWNIDFSSKSYDYEDEDPIEANDQEYHFYYETDCMYNDFGSTSHRCRINKDLQGGSYEYCYSGKSQCMWCGSTCIDFEDDSDMVLLCCDDCETIVYCDCCDNIIPDTSYEIDGEIICECCLDNRTVKCAITKEEHLDYHMTEIRIRDKDCPYSSSIYIYSDVFENLNLYEYFTDYNKPYYYNLYEVKPENVTEKGWELWEQYDNLKDYLKQKKHTLNEFINLN